MGCMNSTPAKDGSTGSGSSGFGGRTAVADVSMGTMPPMGGAPPPMAAAFPGGSKPVAFPSVTVRPTVAFPGVRAATAGPAGTQRPAVAFPGARPQAVAFPGARPSGALGKPGSQVVTPTFTSKIPEIYTPPDSHATQAEKKKLEAERANVEANTMKEVQRCADLLRQMYRLDLGIWGTEGVMDEDVMRREEMMRRANALFSEAGRIIYRLRVNPQGEWTQDEVFCLEEIVNNFAQQPPKRYDVD